MRVSDAAVSCTYSLFSTILIKEKYSKSNLGFQMDHEHLFSIRVWDFPGGSEEMWVRSLGQEDPPGKEMATHSSILTWRIPSTEEPDELQGVGLQRVRYD